MVGGLTIYNGAAARILTQNTSYNGVGIGSLVVGVNGDRGFDEDRTVQERIADTARIRT